MKSKDDITKRTLSLRLSSELYTQAQALAESQHVSLNNLLVQALQKLLKENREREIERGFAMLADDPDSNVEYAIHAQAEVMLADEY